MNTKSICIITLTVIVVVVLASLGMSFSTPGKPVVFLGMHLAAADSEFIPPVAGALALVVGATLLLLKPKRI